MTTAFVGLSPLFASYEDIPKSFEDLCRLFPLGPLRTSSDYDRGVEVAGSLAGHDLTPDQDAYLTALSAISMAYEDDHSTFEMPQISGLDALKGLLRDHGMTASDLSRLIGAHRSLGSKILNGERHLTVPHLRILTEYFKVSADLFLPIWTAKLAPINGGSLGALGAVHLNAGEVLTVPTLTNMVKTWCQAVGLKGNYGSHSMRKT